MSSSLANARAIVNGMSDAAVLFDAEQRIIHFNAVYVTMAGQRRRLLEKAIAEGREPLRAESDLAAHRQQVLGTGQAVRLAELVMHTESGQTLTVLLTMLPVLEDDRPVGVIEYMRDVTDDARVQTRYRELLALEQARAAELERQVEERTRELQVALEEVTRLSRTDPLTGLLNRRSFNEHALQAIGMAVRHNRSLALIIGDLDHFKKVNDTFGHKVGDLVLVATAQAVTGAVRTCDHVARFGGEEFVVLLTETEPSSVMMVANRICDSVRQIDMAKLSPDASGRPTISLGVAVFPEHGANVEELVTKADEALYHVKANGRNHAELYSASLMAAPTPPPLQVARKLALVIGGEWLSSSGLLDALAPSFDVLTADTSEEAGFMCRQDQVDVIIAGHKEGHESGIEAITSTLMDRPAALRLLVIDDEDLFLGARGAGAAQVDYYLLHRDVREHIAAAIEDGLTRKDVSRQLLLRGGGNLGGAYAAHLQRLERLIESRSLRFDYQPIVHAKSRARFAVEALCRAEDPLFRDPTVLFDAAVQSGAIWRLGRLVRQIAPEPLPRLPPELSMFVNLHPAEVADPELEHSIDARLAGRVVLELTERGAIGDLGRFRERLDRLRQRGCKLAIDDLGAGYASLNAVALLEPDFLKIDMTIIRGIDESLARSRLVRRIVEFANDQGIQVIAEGVETSAEVEVVEELGCHLLQGYLFGKPGAV
jgi:diguanylate cyclase (GGDEF)-like protein/PAS domain S-box-containing protein